MLGQRVSRRWPADDGHRLEPKGLGNIQHLARARVIEALNAMHRKVAEIALQCKVLPGSARIITVCDAGFAVALGQRDEQHQRPGVAGPGPIALGQQVEEHGPVRGVAQRIDHPPRLKIGGGGRPAGRFEQSHQLSVRDVEVPLYSHLTYDVLKDRTQVIDQPDILIVEGINVLQTGRPPRDGRGIPNVSDFFDFSIFIDADVADLKTWYIERFFSLRNGAFKDPKSYFHRYASLSDEQALEFATRIWHTVNLVNLRENILPTRPRADLVLRKGADWVGLRFEVIGKK